VKKLRAAHRREVDGRKNAARSWKNFHGERSSLALPPTARSYAYVMTQAVQKRWTYEELIAQGLDPEEHEILDGELAKVKILGLEGARFFTRLGRILETHAEKERAGAVYTTGRFLFSNEPRRERRPDLAFVRKGRVPQGDPDLFPGAPDLVVEILSPSDPSALIYEKVRKDLEGGALEAWIVDPVIHLIIVLRPGQPARPFGVGDTLTTPLLPGLELSLAELFAPLPG
jgi:Uma2 family endonuclease